MGAKALFCLSALVGLPTFDPFFSLPSSLGVVELRGRTRHSAPLILFMPTFSFWREEAVVVDMSKRVGFG